MQCELAQARLARETKATVDRSEVIEALERLTLNTRQHILTLPLKIRATLGLNVDAQEEITKLVYEILTQLSSGVFTIHDAVAYKEKAFSELTADEVCAMSYAMMSNRTFMSDEDKEEWWMKSFARRSAMLVRASRCLSGAARVATDMHNDHRTNNRYVYGLFVEGDETPFYIGNGSGKRIKITSLMPMVRGAITQPKMNSFALHWRRASALSSISWRKISHSPKQSSLKKV